MEIQNSHSVWKPSWFAVYTRSRHEQSVKRQLDRKGVEGFLPTYSRVSQWRDRKKVIELPLFPSYLFVKVPPINRGEVLTAFGVVGFVGDGCTPLPVPEDQILNIHRLLETGLKYDPHPYLQIGHRVRIANGPLEGIEGILSRKKSHSRLIVSIDLIGRSVSVEIDSWQVDRI
jgi:transcription antitermination factor NusG